MKIFQKGFNYSQDGPGNRLVYHLQGCNFRCLWCANPESMPPLSDGAADVPVQDVVDEILRSRMMFFDGGGVTFTGGEPTLQAAELTEVLRQAQAAGVHTAIETNGSHPQLAEIARYVDCLMFDLKQPDDAIHREYTGHSNRQTLENLRLLAEDRQVHVRIPLVNGVNDDPQPFLSFLKTVNTANLTVELLPYHEFGKCKWTTPYRITNGFVSEEQLAAFADALRTAGITLIQT